jgi:DNA-directed RNA polymerase specialized sigma24 family protein
MRLSDAGRPQKNDIASLACQKRRGNAAHIPIDASELMSPAQMEQIVAVDLALQRLAKIDERKSRGFEMRLFGGLSVDEVAEALGVAPNTVIRDWSFTRAWLRRELGVIGTVHYGALAKD